MPASPLSRILLFTLLMLLAVMLSAQPSRNDYRERIPSVRSMWRRTAPSGMQHKMARFINWCMEIPYGAAIAFISTAPTPSNGPNSGEMRSKCFSPATPPSSCSIQIVSKG